MATREHIQYLLNYPYREPKIDNGKNDDELSVKPSISTPVRPESKKKSRESSKASSFRSALRFMIGTTADIGENTSTTKVAIDDYQLDVQSTKRLSQRVEPNLQQKTTFSQVVGIANNRSSDDTSHQSMNITKSALKNYPRSSFNYSDSQLQVSQNHPTSPTHTVDDSLAEFSLNQWNKYEFSPATKNAEETMAQGYGASGDSLSVSSYLTPHQPDSVSPFEVDSTMEVGDFNDVTRNLFYAPSTSTENLLNQHNAVEEVGQDSKVPLWQKKKSSDSRSHHHFIASKISSNMLPKRIPANPLDGDMQTTNSFMQLAPLEETAQQYDNDSDIDGTVVIISANDEDENPLHVVYLEPRSFNCIESSAVSQADRNVTDEVKDNKHAAILRGPIISDTNISNKKQQPQYPHTSPASVTEIDASVGNVSSSSSSSSEIDDIRYDDPLFDTQCNPSKSVVVVEHIPARVLSSADKKSFRSPFLPMVAVYKEMIRCEVAEKEMYLYGDDDNLAYFHEETKSFSYQCMFPPEILDSTMNYSIDLSIVQSQSIDDFEQYYYSDVTAAELVYVNEANSSGDEVWSENSTDLTVDSIVHSFDNDLVYNTSDTPQTPFTSWHLAEDDDDEEEDASKLPDSISASVEVQGDFNAADRSFVRTDADSRSIESFEQMDSVAPNVISTANARIEQMEQKNNQAVGVDVSALENSRFPDSSAIDSPTHASVEEPLVNSLVSAALITDTSGNSVISLQQQQIPQVGVDLSLTDDTYNNTANISGIHPVNPSSDIVLIYSNTGVGESAEKIANINGSSALSTSIPADVAMTTEPSPNREILNDVIVPSNSVSISESNVVYEHILNENINPSHIGGSTSSSKDDPDRTAIFPLSDQAISTPSKNEIDAKEAGRCCESVEEIIMVPSCAAVLNLSLTTSLTDKIPDDRVVPSDSANSSGCSSLHPQTSASLLIASSSNDTIEDDVIGTCGSANQLTLAVTVAQFQNCIIPDDEVGVLPVSANISGSVDVPPEIASVFEPSNYVTDINSSDIAVAPLHSADIVTDQTNPSPNQTGSDDIGVSTGDRNVDICSVQTLPVLKVPMQTDKSGEGRKDESSPINSVSSQKVEISFDSTTSSSTPADQPQTCDAVKVFDASGTETAALRTPAATIESLAPPLKANEIGVSLDTHASSGSAAIPVQIPVVISAPTQKNINDEEIGLPYKSTATIMEVPGTVLSPPHTPSVFSSESTSVSDCSGQKYVTCKVSDSAIVSSPDVEAISDDVGVSVGAVIFALSAHIPRAPSPSPIDFGDSVKVNDRPDFRALLTATTVTAATVQVPLQNDDITLSVEFSIEIPVSVGGSSQNPTTTSTAAAAVATAPSQNHTIPPDSAVVQPQPLAAVTSANAPTSTDTTNDIGGSLDSVSTLDRAVMAPQGASVSRTPLLDLICVSDSVNVSDSSVNCAVSLAAAATAVPSQNDDINLSVEYAVSSIGVHVSIDTNSTAAIGTIEPTSTNITNDPSVSFGSLTTLDSSSDDELNKESTCDSVTQLENPVAIIKTSENGTGDSIMLEATTASEDLTMEFDTCDLLIVAGDEEDIFKDILMDQPHGGNSSYCSTPSESQEADNGFAWETSSNGGDAFPYHRIDENIDHPIDHVSLHSLQHVCPPLPSVAADQTNNSSVSLTSDEAVIATKVVEKQLHFVTVENSNDLSPVRSATLSQYKPQSSNSIDGTFEQPEIFFDFQALADGVIDIDDECDVVLVNASLEGREEALLPSDGIDLGTFITVDSDSESEIENHLVKQHGSDSYSTTAHSTTAKVENPKNILRKPRSTRVAKSSGTCSAVTEDQQKRSIYCAQDTTATEKMICVNKFVDNPTTSSALPLPSLWNSYCNGGAGGSRNSDGRKTAATVLETDDKRRNFLQQEGTKHRALLLLLAFAIVSLVSYCLLPELGKLVSQKATLSTTTSTISPQSSPSPVVSTFDSIPARRPVILMKDLPVSITLSSKHNWKNPLRKLLQTVSRIFKTAVRLFCGMPEEHRNVLGL